MVGLDCTILLIAFCGKLCTLCHLHHWFLYWHIICYGHRQMWKCISYRFWSVCCRGRDWRVLCAGRFCHFANRNSCRPARHLVWVIFQKYSSIWYRMFYPWSLLMRHCPWRVRIRYSSRIIFSLVMGVYRTYAFLGKSDGTGKKVPKSSRTFHGTGCLPVSCVCWPLSPSIWLERDCVMRLTRKIYDRSWWVWNK